MQRTLTRERILEWVDDPVTEFLLSLIAGYVQDLRNVRGVNCYVPFEPHRTQEAIAQLAGQEKAWGDITEVLEGDWTVFSTGDEQDDEYLRYLSEGEQGSSEA